MYAVFAALAAVIIANQTEWRRSRFTIYVISQMWIECTFAVILWCIYVVVGRLLARVKEHGSEYSVRALVKPWSLFLLALNLVVLLMFFPPIAYMVKVRYEFWTTRVLRSYVEAAKYRIDQQAALGRLDTALNTVRTVSEVTKGTAEEPRLDNRRRVLEAVIHRSDVLDKASSSQWNFVTERSKFFSLVESVRIDPENSGAADRLAQKLSVVKGFLAEDTSTICSSQGKLTAFSGKAVALIEARALREKYGSSDRCPDLVRNELLDGWGISAITCIVERNQAIRHGTAGTSSGSRTCPDGLDFWTPVAPRAFAGGDTELIDAYRHPIYPTFVDLWWRQRRHSQK